MSIRRAINFACLWVWVAARQCFARPALPRAGQSTVELALICAFIAAVCIPAIGLLRDSIATLYLTHQVAVGGPVHLPTPTPTP